MSILSIENLSFGFGDKTLLKNISFNLFKGDHAGLVGVNGTGKTTLFNILVGRLIPDEGKVHCPSSINIGYLDQHVDLEDVLSIRDTLKTSFHKLYEKERKILKIGNRLANSEKEETEKLLKELGHLQDELFASDFYKIDSFIDNVAAGLGLFTLGMDTTVDKLSGGQRTKVKLAKLLLESPDLMLLDEPTNYLDKEHIEWLSDYLKSYSNSFIVISHDTEFLNKITNVIYHVAFTNLKRYPGNYNSFLKLQDEEAKRYIEQYHRQQKEIAKMENFISKNIVRATTTKRAQSRRKQLEKIERLEKPKFLSKPIFSFLPARESSRTVFTCKEMNIGYSYPIIQGLSLKVERGQKIAITGCNGIGKSTLLKTIMGVIPPISGKVELGDFLYPVYFEQETKAKDCTAFDEVWNEFPQKPQSEIRGALGRCGLKNEHVLQKISQLSGGEQAKVRLCKLMMTPGNWLLLDEPTNHLDVHAKQALKEALIKFDGTILLVCHEKEFYDGWVTEVWNMEECSTAIL